MRLLSGKVTLNSHRYRVLRVISSRSDEVWSFFFGRYQIFTLHSSMQPSEQRKVTYFEKQHVKKMLLKVALFVMVQCFLSYFFFRFSGNYLKP